MPENFSTISLADAEAQADEIKAIMSETRCVFEQAVDEYIRRRQSKVTTSKPRWWGWLK